MELRRTSATSSSEAGVFSGLPRDRLPAGTDVCFVSDARLETNGLVYWDRRQSFPEGHWAEAMETFPKVAVAARVRHADTTEQFGPLLPVAVQVVEFPHFVGFREALKRLPRLLILARRCAYEADLCVLRGPGLLSLLVWTFLVLRRRHYAVEVLGDLEEVFAVSESRIRRLFRYPIAMLLRRICGGAVAALYVSGALRQKYPAAPGAFNVVVSDVRMPRALFREPEEMKRPPERLVLFHVGNMERPYKGHETMIRALSRCKQRGLNLEMHFVGDGRMRGSFEKLAQELGVEQDAIFEGGVPWGEKLFEKLDAAHLFVFPSLTEAIGKALIEAMARGLPVIATRVGGIPELVDDDMLIPANDPESLSDRIVAVAGDHIKLNSMARRCYENATLYMDERLSPLRHAFYGVVRTTSLSERERYRT